MRLPFQRPPADPPLSPPEAAPKRPRKSAQAAPDASVEAARTRARRRLVGAVVLLAIGIVAFPMLFETRPRPLALDTPIRIAQREPQTATDEPARSLPPKPVRPIGSEPLETILESNPRADAAAAASGPPAVMTDRPASAPLPEPAPSLSPSPPPEPAPKPAPTSAATSAPTSAPPPAPKPAATPQHTDDGARARALLEGAPAATAPAPTGDRFVVQVGAYSEAGALRDARSRVERLGMKSYTQVIANDAGRRTRVRVGPFTKRADADAAAARLKRDGLPASVLTL